MISMVHKSAFSTYYDEIIKTFASKNTKQTVLINFWPFLYIVIVHITSGFLNIKPCILDVLISSIHHSPKPKSGYCPSGTQQYS